ncbi:hypothetical protein PUR57_25300 [Streptomyces sp. JV176]|uniref:hypothetical protein n=1 Tax=Streptomyces sp. JV176 TaxID=858630 RepID=UPI002E7A8960|nr:hypothetical protein [Streptomyces sp. JV176]MEE1801966.1 hypothetical protein [Streptomyces sp. JV176]
MAPLGPGGTAARHRAVRRLLAGTRLTARPWPGGGWQLADRAGRWRHCEGLDALWTAVRALSGPVITPDPGDTTRVWSLPDPYAPDPHALVVWTAAALRAGPASGALTVRAAGWSLTGGPDPDTAPVLHREEADPATGGAGGVCVEAPWGARALATDLARVCAPPDEPA